jgi:alanine racemase
MAVVKADAYGHGLVDASKAALLGGVDVLGVGDLEEALRLRDAKIHTPILILGGISKEEELEEVIRHNITPTIFNFEIAKSLSEISARKGISTKIHIKIDTGMGRLGFHYTEAVQEIKKIAQLPALKLEGLFSHLATADEVDKSYATEQFEKFQFVIEELQRIGIRFPLTHIANSAAILDLPEMHLELVRPGITLYGLFPSDRLRERIALKPAMEFKTVIIHLKKLPKGSGVSYGRTYTTRKEEKIAVLKVGYANGYSRALSNKGEVLIRGKRAPVIGRVCMDLCMVDVTHIPGVQVGDEVVLFGRQNDSVIEVDEIAQKANTINYEIITTLKAPRRVIHE